MPEHSLQKASLDAWFSPYLFLPGQRVAGRGVFVCSFEPISCKLGLTALRSLPAGAVHGFEGIGVVGAEFDHIELIGLERAPGLEHRA